MGYLSGRIRFLGRLVLAGFKISAYTLIFAIQIVWLLAYKRPDEIGESFGDYGRSVTDAVAKVFEG